MVATLFSLGAEMRSLRLVESVERDIIRARPLADNVTTSNW